MKNDLATRIDALLPQTQCTRCGFDGCRPYAEAIAEDRADIDQCPPGGNEGVVALAKLLRRATPSSPPGGHWLMPASSAAIASA